jgi:hypothetical protein
MPAGKAKTTVLPIGVNAPVALIENPEMFADPVFEVYRYFPFGVTLTQQVRTPRVGTLGLMAEYAPFAPSE